MAVPDRVTLTAGVLRAVLCPAVGGSVARFDLLRDGDVVALLRGNDGPYVDVLEAALFPLVPFVNRVRGGTFTCDGRAVRLPPNLPGDPSPLHGQGWRNPWTLAAIDETSAELTYEHGADDWPWHYTARQRFVVDAGGLDIELSCTNHSPEPMPCGMGLHPYASCASDTRIDTGVDTAWTVDADVLPVAEVPACGRYALADTPVCGRSLDNGFGGWNGDSLVTWPSRGVALRMTSPDARWFQLYSPATGGVFVAEPVQHANAALNRAQPEWAAAGLQMLARGESRTLRVRFAPTTAEASTPSS